MLADIVTQLVHFSQIEYNLHLVSSEFRSENIETCTPIKSEQLKRLFCEPRFFQTMRPIRGARRALTRLMSRGHMIHIVTDRFWYPGIQDDTRNWLASRMIRVNSVNFARKTEKQSVARKLGIDWFIEDQRSNANLLSGVCRVVLINRPYNHGFLNPDVLRVNTLQEAVEVVLDNSEKEYVPAENRVQEVVPRKSARPVPFR